MITNLGTTSRTVYSLSIIVVRILKQQLTSPFTASIIVVQGKRFHKINQVSGTIVRQNDSTIKNVLLFGDNKLDFETSKILLMSKIEFISLTERFSCPLFE